MNDSTSLSWSYLRERVVKSWSMQLSQCTLYIEMHIDVYIGIHSNAMVLQFIILQSLCSAPLLVQHYCKPVQRQLRENPVQSSAIQWKPSASSASSAQAVQRWESSAERQRRRWGGQLADITTSHVAIIMMIMMITMMKITKKETLVVTIINNIRTTFLYF